MAQQKFAVDAGGAKDLVIRWKGFWKNIEVVYRDQVLGEPIPNLKALKQGDSYRLPDGRMVQVRFVQKFGAAGLEVTVDGRPVAGASNDPRTAIKSAAVLLYIIAGLNLVIGGVALGVAGLRAFGIGWPTLVFGLVLGVLGFCVHKYRSQAAILAAIIIELLDGVWILYAMVEAGGRVQPHGLIFRVFIIVALVRAFKAVKEAKALEVREVVDTFE